MKDRIYQKKLKKVQDFQFNQQVSSVFEDMIERSVPSYSHFIEDSAQVASWLYDKTQNIKSKDENYFSIYDLGSSTLASSIAIIKAINQADVKIYAIDNSASMIEKAKKIREKEMIKKKLNGEIELILSDIRKISLNQHNLSVLNFTLQFINSEQKTKLLKKIFDSLKIGGVLIFAEKIIFNQAKNNQLIDDLIKYMHHNFKKMNGYSDLEIEQNLAALKNIMYLEDSQTHLKRLKKIGFKDCTLFRQSLNFASIVAIKSE